MSTTALNRVDQFLTGRWIDLSLVVFAALAWSSTFLQLARGVVQFSPKAEIAILLLGATTFGALTWLGRRFCLGSSVHSAEISAWRRIGFVLFVGVVLRVAWVSLFPATPASDGATYISLAYKLLNGARYESAGTLAYWPPGYPLFLAPWLFLLPAPLAIPLSQIVLFVVGALGIHRLTKLIASQAAASVAVVLFAAWPSLIAMTSTPEKEILILALLPWGMYWALHASLKTALLSGISLGVAVLVQPSLQLLIPVLGLFLVVRNGLKYLPGALIFITAALLTIAPWSLRNFQVLGAFKLVSTNGGDVLYRANNPLATGGYTERGAIDLSQLSELERDRQSRELALRWIRENPWSFARLAVEKQVRFMGDDAYGIYTTFRAKGEKRENRLYVPLKILANAWNLLVWLLLASYVLKGHRLPNDARVVIWAWYYLFALHSVFEAGAKYHVPMIWVLCVVLGVLSTKGSYPERVEKIN